MVMTLVATLSRNDNFANAGPGAGGGGGMGGSVGGDDFHSGGSGSGTYVSLHHISKLKYYCSRKALKIYKVGCGTD